MSSSGAAGTRNSTSAAYEPPVRRRTLLSRVSSLAALRLAFAQVARAGRGSAGIDEISVAAFAKNSERRIREIKDQLLAGSYRFSALRAVALRKKDRNAYRPLLIPTVADRVVQRAILRALERPLGAHLGGSRSHAFRREAGVKTAVHQLASGLRDGRRVVLTVDIVNFFTTIDTRALFEDVVGLLPDPTLNPLLRQLQHWEIAGLTSLPSDKRKVFPAQGHGLPQGSALSPILSNFYMRDFDRDAEAQQWSVVRYADDIAIACTTRAEAEEAFAWLKRWTARLGLETHELGSPKARIWQIGERLKGVEYLGCFVMPVPNGIKIQPSDASFKHAENSIIECLSPNSESTLAERFDHLGFFLRSWVSTYTYICGSVARERERLLYRARSATDELLRSRRLAPQKRPLTQAQLEFLGIESIFRNAG